MNPSDTPAPRHVDWLRHDLVVTGPAGDVAALRDAAAGAGAIPWRYPDIHLEEEDRVHLLLRPPDGSPGLSLQGARALARMLRGAAEARHGRVVEAVARGNRSCPLDLHALLPVPDHILRLGPDDPASRTWLREHWGTVRALRHVRVRADAPDGRGGRWGRGGGGVWGGGRGGPPTGAGAVRHVCPGSSGPGSGTARRGRRPKRCGRGGPGWCSPCGLTVAMARPSRSAPASEVMRPPSNAATTDRRWTGANSEQGWATVCQHRDHPLRRSKALLQKNFRLFRGPVHLIPVRNAG